MADVSDSRMICSTGLASPKMFRNATMPNAPTVPLNRSWLTRQLVDHTQQTVNFEFTQPSRTVPDLAEIASRIDQYRPNFTPNDSGK
jgi:hypothetical protein